MSSDTPRLIEIGTMPSGYASTFVAEGAVDPLAIMIAQADAKLAHERATEAKAKAAKVADIGRMRLTRRSRIARRFRKALKMWRAT